MSALAQRGGVPLPRRTRAARRSAGEWGRFVLLLALTALVLAPLGVVLTGALVGPDGQLSPARVVLQLGSGLTLRWLANSLLVTAATVTVTVTVAAPGGYALARMRGRAIDLYSVVLFGLQSLPAMVLLPPLFVLLVQIGGADSLLWLVVLYVGFSVAVATWTMSSWFTTLPIEAEEAALLDGCSAFGAFVRIVLPGSGPALLSTALITFLFAWNEYWIALLFIQDQTLFTLGLGLVSSGRTPALALVAALPPLVLYLALHRWFRFGGTADAAMPR